MNRLSQTTVKRKVKESSASRQRKNLDCRYGSQLSVASRRKIVQVIDSNSRVVVVPGLLLTAQEDLATEQQEGEILRESKLAPIIIHD